MKTSQLGLKSAISYLQIINSKPDNFATVFIKIQVCMKSAKSKPLIILYTRYPIVARALGLAFRPSARAGKGILHTTDYHIRSSSVDKSNLNSHRDETSSYCACRAIPPFQKLFW